MAIELSTNRYVTQREWDEEGEPIRAEIESCLRETMLSERECFAGVVRYRLRSVSRPHAAFPGEICVTGEISVIAPGDPIPTVDFVPEGSVAWTG